MEENFLDEEILDIEDIDMYAEATKVEKAFKKGKKLTIEKPGVKKTVEEGKSLVNLIYKMKDEDFVEGRFFPMVSRLIVRATAIYGLFLLNPTVGIIAFITDRTIKKSKDVKQRKRLRKYYQDKLEYIEDKISSCSDEKEKYKLVKLRSSLKSNIRKLNSSVTDDSLKGKMGRL